MGHPHWKIAYILGIYVNTFKTSDEVGTFRWFHKFGHFCGFHHSRFSKKIIGHTQPSAKNDFVVFSPYHMFPSLTWWVQLWTSQFQNSWVAHPKYVTGHNFTNTYIIKPNKEKYLYMYVYVCTCVCVFKSLNDINVCVYVYVYIYLHKRYIFA